MNPRLIKYFLRRVQDELETDILPFWLTHSLDHKNGGFIGELSNDLAVVREADKGLVLNTRLLWTFSAMGRFTKKSRCLEVADYAYQTLRNDFLDNQYSGGFWTVNKNGTPVNKLKKTYGQSFFIYGLVEYYLCTGKIEALNLAKELFRLLEAHAYDTEHEGYFEVMEADWQLSLKQQLSEEDMNAPKSMNTHLHLLEAYTHLYSVWKNTLLAGRLRSLIDIFQDKIVDADTGHFKLFFDADWNSKSGRVSFGHDIEGSWLLYRAADVLSDDDLRRSVALTAVRIARAVQSEGIGPKGGLIYESNEKQDVNLETHFWCQAEAVIGFLNAFQLSRQELFLNAAWEIWQFIENYQLDKEHGEWFWKLDGNLLPDRSAPKISEWKCPYHNARACIESVHRLNMLLHGPVQRKKVIFAYEQEKTSPSGKRASSQISAVDK